MSVKELWIYQKTQIPKEIGDFIDELFEIYEIRGCVEEIKGIKFYIHTNEKNHTVPHIHVIYGEYEISIRISDGLPLCGNLPKNKMKMATEWVLKNKTKLLTDWNQIAISALSTSTKSYLSME